MLQTAEVNGTSLVLTYDEALNAGSTPDAGDFAVTNTGASQAVQTVVVSGSTVTLTLAPGVANGDTVTLDYTVGTNPIEDVAGNDALPLTGQAVTNTTPADVTAPVLQTAEVNGTSLVLTYDEALNAGSTPDAGDFAVTNTGASQAVQTVVVSGSTVTLTLAPGVANGDTVTLDYTVGTNPIEDVAGNDALPLTGQAVTNNTGLPVIPQGGWALTFVDSEATGFEGGQAFDGDTMTIWHTQFSPTSPAHPHDLVVDLGAVYSIEGFRQLPRPLPGTNGRIGNYVFYVKTDSGTPPTTPPIVGEWTQVATGTFPNTEVEQEVLFASTDSRYVWLRALDEAQMVGNPWTALAELNVLGALPGGDATAPVLQTAEVNGTSLVLTYDEALNAGSTPDAGDFAVTNTGASQAVQTVVVSGSTVTLTLNPGVANGDTVTLDYTVGTNPIEDVAGNDALPLTGQAVTNTTPADVTAPVLQTAEVNGTSLVLTYDEALNAGSTPDAGDFAVTNTGASQAVQTVVVSGSTVTLTLAPGVANGDTVTLDYTVGTNPIEDVAGNDALPLTGQAVTNTTPADVTAPVLQTAEVNGTSLVLTYDEALNAGSTPDAGDFAVTNTGASQAVQTVVVSGSTVTLTLAPGVANGDTVTLDYTVGTNPIEDVAGNDALPLTGQAVTNNTGLPVIPQGGWALTFVDSEATGFEGGQAFDGDTMTIWHTQFSPTSPAHPHDLVVDLGAVYSIEGFRQLPRPLPGTNGRIGNYVFYVKTDSGTPPTTPPIVGEWTQVATGTFPNTEVEQEVLFASTDSRYVWLRALDEAQMVGNPWTALAELNVLGALPGGDATAPVLQTAEVNGTSLVLTYDEALNAGSTPDAGDFAVTNTGASQAVQTVVVSGSTVTLTLNPGVANGDTVTLDYTVGTNPIEDVAGNDALPLTGQAVTNTTPADVTAPVLQTAEVNGTSLVLTYDEALNAGSTPDAGDFAVTNTGASQAVQTVVVSGSTVTLTLAPGVANGDTVTLDYTVGTNPIEDVAGNDALPLTGQAVTNTTPADVTAPVLQTAEVNGTSLVLTYDEALNAGSTPDAGDFAVTNTGASQAVQTVVVSGSTVTLTLAPGVANGDTVTLDYTVGTNPIEDVAGNDALPLTGQAVTNNTGLPVIPQGGWALTFVDSEATGFEGGQAFDGDTMTIWHTQFSPTSPAHPHDLVVDLGAVYSIEGFRQLPRPLPGTNGRIGNYVFYVKTDSGTPPTTPPIVGEWTQVATGTFPNTEVEQEVLFASTDSRYVWLRALDEAQMVGNPWTALAELNVLGALPGGDATAPVLQTAEVNGTSLVLTYDEALNAGSTPDAGDFAVTNTGASQAVQTVVVSGSTVTLTLNPGVANGDTVTLDYTVGTNPIEDVAGNDALPLTGQAVTNTTPADVTAPVLQTAEVNGTSLVLTYDEALNAGSTPDAGDFAVTNTGASQAVQTVVVSGSTVTLTLAPGVANGDTVTLDYTVGTNPIEDVAGNDALPLTGQAVTNTTADTTPPVVVPPATVDGASLVLTYDEALDTGSTPATGDFVVTETGAGAGPQTVSGVSGEHAGCDADPQRRGWRHGDDGNGGLHRRGPLRSKIWRAMMRCQSDVGKR